MVSAFHSAVQTRPAQLHTAPAAPSLPARYVRVPHKLLTAAAYDPLAVGLYALIARLYLIVQSPLPLSTADVQRYDPTLSRGAVLRGLARLVTGGWLLAEEQVGHKTTYVPTWGRIESCVRPWRMDAPALGRPRHLHALALDVRLLDLYLGKLTLHPTRPALVTRYVTQPLLSLRDIGAYALTLSGIPTTTPALALWNLVHGDLCAPIPTDEDVLRRVSEGVQGDEHTSTLTLKGMQRLGLVTPMPPQLPTGEPPALIGEVIGEGITRVIGSDDAEQPSFPPSERAKTTECSARTTIPWESLGEHVSHGTPPPTPPEQLVGGGMISTHDSRADRAAPRAASETARLLHMLNVRPRQVAELADTPLDVVRAAVADGQARPYVRDLAGWVVAMVRDARREGWQIAPPAAPVEAQALALRASFARLYDAGLENPGEEAGCAGIGDVPAVDRCADEVARASGVAEGAPEAGRDAPQETLTEQLQRELRARTYPDLHPLIARLSVRQDGHAITVGCVRASDLPIVQARLLPLIKAVLSELGFVQHLRLSVVVSARLVS